jgi:hypothetical protein
MLSSGAAAKYADSQSASVSIGFGLNRNVPGRLAAIPLGCASNPRIERDGMLRCGRPV